MATPKAIKTLVYAVGLSQKDLADAAGVSETLATLVFSGQKQSKPFVERAARLLDVSADELLALIPKKAA